MCQRTVTCQTIRLGQAYRDAKIVLNDHWDDMKETGIVSNRLFDALAAEAFIISDEMPEIEEIFEGTVVTYKDCKDLKEKVDYYMEHPKEAEKLAERGHQLVLEKHTFAKRMDKLVQDFPVFKEKQKNSSHCFKAMTAALLSKYQESSASAQSSAAAMT